MKISGNNHCPDSRFWSVCYAAESTEPHHAWERYYTLELTMGCPTGMGELLLCIPRWRRTTQSPFRSYRLAASWPYLNILNLKWNTYYWKRGKGASPSQASPTPSLLPDSAASPGQHVWHIQTGWVPKAPPNFPFLKARWAHSVFHWYSLFSAIFVCSIGLEDVTAYIEDLKTLTQ